MDFVGQHASHILGLQSSPRPLAVPQRHSGIALRLRSLLTLFALFAAVPGGTSPLFARQSTRVALTEVFAADSNIFGIDPRIIGDTKVVITFAGGKTVYEADAN
jgi:hypothetical protein